MKTLSAIEAKLKKHRARKIPGRRWMIRASVAALLTNEESPSVILMRRPEKKGDPWSGDMCMPGGRKEPEDGNSFATVVRETAEEVGLDLERDGTCLGRLSDVMTRAHERARPMIVSPFVFSIRSEQQLALSAEAREIIAVPLAYLAEPANRKTMRWRAGPVDLRMPCYHYRGARVWGLTLIMLDELTRLAGRRTFVGEDWLRMLGLRD